MEDRYNAEGDSVDPLDPEEAERQDVLRRALDCLPAPVAPPATPPATDPVTATAPATVATAQTVVVAETRRRTIPLTRSFFSKLHIWWHRSSALDKFCALYPLLYGVVFALVAKYMPSGYLHREGGFPKAIYAIAVLCGLLAACCLLVAIFISWPRRYKNTDDGFVQENADVAAALSEWIEEHQRLERDPVMPGSTPRRRRQAAKERSEELLKGIRFYALLPSTDEHLRSVREFLFRIDEARRINKLQRKSPLYENRE